MKTTQVYDTYWKFAAERQNIFFRRFGSTPPPWTNDEILLAHKFTNAYRASDRVSQYLIRRVIYRDDLPSSDEEVVFRILLFKIFNRISTWELLQKTIGPLTYSDFSFKKYDSVLTRAMKQGNRIYSAAYIMPSVNKLGFKKKHRNHLKLIERMFEAELPARLANAQTMEEAFKTMKGFPSIGDFLAYQYVIDINYSTVTDFSEMEFIVAGPGALDGIAKCFSDTGGLSNSAVIEMMVERQDAEFDRLGLEFPDLWGRRLQLIDCQNLFCEVDKYARVAHPEESGKSGRTRIKQKFAPNDEPLDFWYPPKWKINDRIAKCYTHSGPEENRSVYLTEDAMNLRQYQQKANMTDRNPGTDELSRMIPLAGLASETGELLGEYKKYLRDGESHKLFKERLSEEVGDLLWYVANVATKFDLDLEEVAEQNLAKCDERWGELPARPPFDAEYPENQRLPRQITLDFSTYHDAEDSPRVRIMYKGEQFGDDLTDNAYAKDGYGYHDVIHLAFAAVLGWSPLVRKMLKAKRKDNLKVDEVEDGARAIVTEEAVFAAIFAYVRDYDFLDGKSSVGTDLLATLRNMISHLEVSVCTTGEWESAIVQGFEVWRALKSSGGGTVDANLDERSITLRDLEGSP